MITVKLVDSTFSNPSFGLAGDCKDEQPKLLRWDRTPGYADVKVFTDLRLHEAENDDAKHKIALIIESPAFSTGAHEYIVEHEYLFDHILTHDLDLIRRSSKYLFYPFGGSWIKEEDWLLNGDVDKPKPISMIVGEKKTSEGQKLRHQIAERYGDRIDLWGKPYTEWFEPKWKALRPYKYSIVIENAKHPYWFTEKLIDCLSQRTIPIYWGDAKKFQTPLYYGCIEQFNDIEKIDRMFEIGLLDNERAYQDYYWDIQRTIEHALEFRIPEDWIARHYHELLGGEDD